jgi:hypothetical protein
VISGPRAGAPFFNLILVRLLIFCLGVVVNQAAVAQPPQPDNPPPASAKWESARDGLWIQLARLGNDQVKAFLVGRGVPLESAQRFASACVFATVLRNASSRGAIAYDVRDWRINIPGMAPRSIKTREKWMKASTTGELTQAARMGFEWSQLPTTQTLEKEDSMQGMTAYELPPGSRFDLLFSWRTAGRTHHGKIQGVRCAQAD